MYRSVVVWVTLLLVGPVVLPAQTANTANSGDSRLRQIQQFFKKHACPVESLAHEFLAASDRHGLDWRLLPSLAFIESRGKTGSDNNLFGWGRVKFASLTEAIHSVAKSLSESHPYRGKTTSEKLKIFNPLSGFLERVHDVMGQIGDAPADAKK